MGYTHYYGMNKSTNNFKQEVLTDVQAILDKYEHLIRREHDSVDSASVKEDRIIFNGIGEEGHETFEVKTKGQTFCKTARKPYDAAVCEVLLVLKHHYGDDFLLSSDGFYVSEKDFINCTVEEAWEVAFQNVQRQFGYTYTFYPVISGSNGNYYFSYTLDPAEAKEVKASVIEDYFAYKNRTITEKYMKAGISSEQEIEKLNYAKSLFDLLN